MEREVVGLSEEGVELSCASGQVDLEAGAARRPASAGRVDLDRATVVTSIDKSVEDLLSVREDALHKIVSYRT